MDMPSLELVQLRPLMERTHGRPEIAVALIDGPVSMADARQWSSNVRHIAGNVPAACEQAGSAACRHGTFVASMLAASRRTPALAICPNCTLLVRSIFPETVSGSDQLPTATSAQLAAAIVDSVNAGARILNMSIGLAPSSSNGDQQLQEALNYAAARGAIPVVAAGNQQTVGSSILTRHPWVIPVVSCDRGGRPAGSTLGKSIATNGLTAPGEGAIGFAPDGSLWSLNGTSAATPFVTGAIALLWSEFPTASARDVKVALLRRPPGRRGGVTPPLLNAWAAHRHLSIASGSAAISKSDALVRSVAATA